MIIDSLLDRPDLAHIELGQLVLAGCRLVVVFFLGVLLGFVVDDTLQVEFVVVEEVFVDVFHVPSPLLRQVGTEFRLSLGGTPSLSFFRLQVFEVEENTWILLRLF